jgi:hypothetical protein
MVLFKSLNSLWTTICRTLLNLSTHNFLSLPSFPWRFWSSSSMSLAKPEAWQSKVAKKQAEVKAAIPTQWLIPPSTRSPSVLDIPRQCGILSKRELTITESYDARQLLHELATGRLTSVEVAEAFSKRAAIAQQLVSSIRLVEILYLQLDIMPDRDNV